MAPLLEGVTALQRKRRSGPVPEDPIHRFRCFDVRGVDTKKRVPSGSVETEVSAPPSWPALCRGSLLSAARRTSSEKLRCGRSTDAWGGGKFT